MGSKLCPTCGIVKPASDFYVNTQQSTGLSGHCKEIEQAFGNPGECIMEQGKRYFFDYIPYRKGADAIEHLPDGFAEGEAAECSYCGGYSVYSRGLRYVGRSRDGIVRIPGLSGFRCRACGKTEWGPESQDEVAAARATSDAPFGVRAKLSKLARNNVGVYIPTDDEPNLRLDFSETVPATKKNLPEAPRLDPSTSGQ